LRHDAAGGNHGALADHNVGKNDRSRPYKRISLDFDALSFLEVGDDGYPHTQRSAIFNGDPIGPGCFKDNIVADPDSLSDFDPARAMQRDAQAPGSRQNSGQMLEEPILEPLEGVFNHGFPCVRVAARQSKQD
jgi:hypothetical protein